MAAKAHSKQMEHHTLQATPCFESRLREDREAVFRLVCTAVCSVGCGLFRTKEGSLHGFLRLLCGGKGVRVKAPLDR